MQLAPLARRALGAVLSLLVVVPLAASPARAGHDDPCVCRGPRVARGRSEARCRTLGWGDGGWRALRRGLDRRIWPTTHRHPRFFLLERWPWPADGGHPAWGDLRCVGLDHGPSHCPLVTDGAAPPARDAGLDALLAHGHERLFRGEDDAARASFDRAAEAAPRDPRAWYGLLLARALGHDWDGAVDALARLLVLEPAAAREPLLVEEVTADEGGVLAYRDALAAYTRYSFHEVDAQLVAAWLHLVTGAREQARRHLASALRFEPDHPVARALVARLEAPAPRAPSDAGASSAPSAELARRAP